MQTLKEYYKRALDFKPQHPLDKDTADFICEFINDNKISKMLEIGSGVGYSANYFALNSTIFDIDSYEKQFGFYLFAKQNSLSKKIRFIYEDFLSNILIDNIYPLIFIDASKTKQIEIFEKAINYLSNDGVIIVDNIGLKRLREKYSLENDKNTKVNKSIEKIFIKNEEFKNYLNNLECMSIKYLDIGDGIVLCQKK